MNDTVITLIIRTIQLFEHPPFLGKMIFGIRTPTFEIIICQSVPAFDSLCGVQTGVAKRVIVFNGLCGAQTGVAKHAIAFDSLCGARTSVTSVY